MPFSDTSPRGGDAISIASAAVSTNAGRNLSLPFRRSFSLFGARPLSRGGPPVRKNSVAYSMFKSRPGLVTAEEYESLPPSIQKKFFSATERLKLSQELAARKRRKHSLSHLPVQPPTSIASTKPITRRKSDLVSTDPPPSIHSRKPSIARSAADVNEDQAIHFLGLPDKVKRANFTTEELVLLTASSERALGLPLTKCAALWRRYADDEPKVSAEHVRSSPVPKPTVTTFLEDEKRDEIDQNWAAFSFPSSTTREASPTSTCASPACSHGRHTSATSMLSSSTLPSTHAQSPSLQEWRRPLLSGRRAITLTPIPLPPPTLAPAVPPIPSPTTLQSMHVSIMPPSPVSDDAQSPARFHKDSEVRQKVRRYLSARDETDESMSATFLSNSSSDERSAPSTPSLAGFYYSDNDQFSEDNQPSSDQPTLFRSPVTPVDVHIPSTGKTSIDSGVDLSASDHASQADLHSLRCEDVSREATPLRLVRTLPGALQPEMELYLAQRRQFSGVEVAHVDALALEALPICDDHTGAHGAFAVPAHPPGGLKRYWKSIRGR